jgi:hypothetical protein
VRIIAGFLIVAAIVASGWILSLPTKAECAASGRTVDPTERHCVSSSGYEQLEEHAAFHATQVALGVVVVLAGAYVVRRYLRRRSAGGASTA